MQSVHVRRRSEGFNLLEVLIAITIFAIIAVVVLYGVSATGKALGSQHSSQSQASELENTVDRMFASANTSESIFLPSSCGGNGPGDGTSCSQVRFYGKDAAGNAHFWGWSWDSAAQTLTEYRDLPSADAQLSSGQEVVSLANVTAFTAVPQNASYWAASLGLSNVVTQEARVVGSSLDPGGRVVGGNRTMTVTISTSSGVIRSAVLLSHDATFSQDVVNYQVETPQVGTSLVCSSPSCDLSFVNALSPPQTATFTDSNFGQYLPYIGANPPWNVSSCTNSYGLVVATLGPISNSGDSVSVPVSPKLYGSCTFTVSNFAGVSVTETINVGGSPGDSLVLNPGNTTLSPGQSQAGSFSEVGPIITGNFSSFPTGSGSQGVNTTCDPQEVGSSIAGYNFKISTAGKTPVTKVVNCQIVYYDIAYDAANPYTSNLIYVEQVTLIPAPAQPPGNPGPGNPGNPAPGSTPSPVPGGPVVNPPGPVGVPTLPPVPIPSPPLVGSCGTLNSYGDPTGRFIQPPYNAAPAMDDLYAAVSARSLGGLYDQARTPNGNVIYGYFDDWNGPHPSNTNGTKGAFLMSENTDCTVTVLVSSESMREYIQYITYSMEFRNVSNGYPVDAIDESGGTNQGYCIFSYQNGFGFDLSQAPLCNTSVQGVQQADQSPPAMTGFVPRISDYAIMSLSGTNAGPFVGASRVVLYPSQNLAIVPTPRFFHLIVRAGSQQNGGGPYDYADGSGEYATAAISAVGANRFNATAAGLYRSPGAIGVAIAPPTPQPAVTPMPDPSPVDPQPVQTYRPVPCGKSNGGCPQ